MFIKLTTGVFSSQNTPVFSTLCVCEREREGERGREIVFVFKDVSSVRASRPLYTKLFEPGFSARNKLLLHAVIDDDDYY